MTWKTGLDGKIRDDRGRVTPWVPQQGRKYLNTKTGEIITRRQFDKMSGRVVGSNEQKAKRNKQDDELAQLMRPARGRKKAKTLEEGEERIVIRKGNVKKIRPQLLKTGHLAERIRFFTYADYKDLLEQAQKVKAPNGRRLITSYGWGIDGIDERPPHRKLGATLGKLASPNDVLKEIDFNQAVLSYLLSTKYFLFKSFFMHLHFDREYAQSRLKKSKLKNLKKGKK